MPSYAQRFYPVNSKQVSPALPAQVYDLAETQASGSGSPARQILTAAEQTLEAGQGRWTNGGSSVTLRSNDFARTGTWSLRVQGTAGVGGSQDAFAKFMSGGYVDSFNAMGLVAGRTYVVKGWRRYDQTSIPDGRVPATVYLFNSGGSILLSATATWDTGLAPAINTFGAFTLTFTVPAGSTGADLRLYHGESQGLSWFDDLFFEEQAVPAGSTNTSITWTTTTPAYKRVVPYAGSTATTNPPAGGAAPANVGWRMKVSDANSSSGEPRYIAPGIWTFLLNITTGSYALLAANPNYTLTAIVYRVSAAGVGTELFRASTNAAGYGANTSVALTATFNQANGYTLAVGETLQVEFYVLAAATANAVGTVTNNVVSVQTDISYMNLGAPLRTVATRTASDTQAASVDTPVRVQASIRRTADTQSLTTDTATRRAAVNRVNTEAITLADSVVRRVTAVRATSESIVLADSTTRTQVIKRSTSEAVTLADSTRREVAARRFTSEAVAFTDSPQRVATYPRSGSESVVVTDSPSRVYIANRSTPDAVPPQADATTRLYSASRRATDIAPAPVEASIKLVTYGRTVRYQFQPGDEPLIDPVKAITGVVRTSEGAIYTDGALVILYRTDTNVAVQTAISGADGRYAFPRNSYDVAQYYVAAFITTPSAQQAVTERTLVAT